MLEISYSPEIKDLKKAAIEPFRRNPILYVIILVCAIQAIIGIIGAIGITKVDNYGSALIIGLVIPFIIYVAFYISFRTSIKSHDKIKIELDNYHFKLITNPGNEESQSWEKIIKVRECKDLYYLFPMAYYAIPINKKELRSNDKLFREFILQNNKIKNIKMK